MREIKYKAKRTRGKQWVYGSYFFNPFDNRHYIKGLTEGGTQFEDFQVTPKTVCQYIKTIADVDIYENDKLKGDDDLSVYCLIEWSDEKGNYEINDYGYDISYGEGSQEIISNDIEKVDENIYDIEDINPSDLIGNIHDKN